MKIFTVGRVQGLQPVHMLDRSKKEAVVASSFTKLVPSCRDRHVPGMDLWPNLDQVVAGFFPAGEEVSLS